MLSAQKQEMPSHTAPEASRPPATTGFGKVLNSIQGLQQRLDDFSVEEVSRAHAQAHELIRELGDLQAQLDELAKLKKAIANIAARIAVIPEADFDHVAPNTWEKHPQLRAIMQTAKRIQMQRLLQAGHQSQTSSASEIKTAPTGSPATDALERLPENPAPSRIESIVAEVKAVTPRASEATLPAADTAIRRKSKPSRTYEFSELKLEEAPQPSSLPKKDSPQPAVSGGNHTPTRKSKKVKGKTHFDQRLLNDLIETYGEFAIPTKSANCSERSEAAATGPGQIVPAKSGPTAEQSTTLKLPTAQPNNIVDMPAIVPIPVEPAFVQTDNRGTLSLPGPVEESAGPSFDEALSSAKSRGEIDRQLKSIIKDYGQVDLYSQQPSHNLKTVIIAAVVALALLLGVLYFFKSSSKPAPTTIEATIPANEIQDPSAKNIKQKN